MQEQACDGAYARLGLRVRVTVAETDGDEKDRRVRVADCVRIGVVDLERERVADTERLEGDGDSGSSLGSGVDDAGRAGRDRN